MIKCFLKKNIIIKELKINKKCLPRGKLGVENFCLPRGKPGMESFYEYIWHMGEKEEKKGIGIDTWRMKNNKIGIGTWRSNNRFGIGTWRKRKRTGINM